MAITVLAVVIFLYDNLKEKRSGIECFKTSGGTLIENRWYIELSCSRNFKRGGQNTLLSVHGPAE